MFQSCQPLGLTSPHDTEEGWHLETMQRLQTSQPYHRARPLSDIQHWYIPCFLQAGSFEGLLPSASQPSRCIQNSHHHSLWNICVPLLYIRATQQWSNHQRMMNQIFGHVPYCRVYIDDILVASETHREQREHLHSVLELLHKNGLVIRETNVSLEHQL